MRRMDCFAVVLSFALFLTAFPPGRWSGGPVSIVPARVSAQGLPPIPSTWNGINYYPRRHQFYNMLNDWFTTDQTEGIPVSQMVNNDLGLLRSNGFNFVHLYIWDSDWFGIGFNPIGQDPSTSPNNQWGALDGFLSEAESNGIYVGIHFVSKSPINRLNCGISTGDANQMGIGYSNWTGAFMNYFSPRHMNILMWGFAFALGPVPDVGGSASSWNAFFASAYSNMYSLAHSTAPAPGLGLMAIDIGWGASPDPNGYDYSWDAARAQRAAKVVLDLQLPEADIYMLQLYNANSSDLQRDLATLTQTQQPNGIQIAASKILAVEFATSSSLASAPYGNQVASSGDSNTPTFDLNGQAAWLTNTLCAFRNVGIGKLAYWGLYDAYDFWQAAPFCFGVQDLAWNGYWGLLPLPEGYGAKPSWTVLTSFYMFRTLNCSSPPAPDVSLTSNVSSVPSGKSFTLTWTASDTSYMSIDQGVGQVTTSLGSKTIIAGSPGTVTYTLTATNGGQVSTASATVVITDPTAGPAVAAVTDSNYSLTLNSGSVIVVWGAGFTPTGGNTVQLQRPGFPDVWLYETDGHYYWDQATGQINSALDNRAAPGQWTVTVRDASAAPSAPFTITLNPDPNCGYSLSSNNQSFDSTGGTGTISVSAGSVCQWTATVVPPAGSCSTSFVSIASGGTGSGAGTITFAVASNPGTYRSAVISITGPSPSSPTQNFQICQGPAPGF